MEANLKLNLALTWLSRTPNQVDTQPQESLSRLAKLGLSQSTLDRGAGIQQHARLKPAPEAHPATLATLFQRPRRLATIEVGLETLSAAPLPTELQTTRSHLQDQVQAV